MNDGIKTKLFSFKTFRSPDKIGKDEHLGIACHIRILETVPR